MAKVSSIQKNKKRQRMIKQYLPRRNRLKALVLDLSLSSEERFVARLKLAELPRNSSPTRYRLRCELTGRPRGNYKMFQMCRHKLRELGNKGEIPGLIKGSW